MDMEAALDETWDAAMLTLGAYAYDVDTSRRPHAKVGRIDLGAGMSMLFEAKGLRLTRVRLRIGSKPTDARRRKARNMLHDIRRRLRS